MYFINCQTVAEIKTKYHELAFQYHPDLGTEQDRDVRTEQMKQINLAYEKALEASHGQKTKGSDGKEHTYYYNENIEREVMDKISEFLSYKFKNVELTLVGTWLWVEGDTKPIKDKLGKDGLGFKWHSKRKMWYWRKYTGKKKYSNASFDELKQAYGSKTYRTDEDNGLAVA